MVQFDCDLLAVKVAGKIEQMHLQQFLRRIEHRAYADVRGPVEYPTVGKAAAPRINAIGRARIVAQTQLGGGTADGAAKLVAMADLAIDRDGQRQTPGGGRYATGRA